MGREKGIVLDIRKIGEERKKERMEKCEDEVEKKGKDIVRIGMMEEIKDDEIIGCVEKMMKRKSKLKKEKEREKMKESGGKRVDKIGEKLLRKLRKVMIRKGEKKVWSRRIIEERC